MIDTCALKADSPQKTEQIGASLAQSLYGRNVMILLRGELGAGKTTFMKGFARGLHIDEPVTSPTYAIENRYDDALLHIDLHRLRPEQTRDVLRAAAEFPGIVAIEWSENAANDVPLPHRAIVVEFAEGSATERAITITFEDIELPSDREIDGWHEELKTLGNIREHERAVCDAALRLAKDLMARGTVIRTQALRCAALTHDMLRVIDLKNPESDDVATMQRELKEKYPMRHEDAACAFLAERGYPEIGDIVRTHGAPHEEMKGPVTNEQKLLCYADKRARHHEIVSLDERFDDFIARYGGGKESQFAKDWRAQMKALEKELFPEGVPF